MYVCGRRVLLTSANIYFTRRIIFYEKVRIIYKKSYPRIISQWNIYLVAIWGKIHENIERETSSLKVEIKFEHWDIILLMPTTSLTSNVHACTVDQGDNQYSPIKLFLNSRSLHVRWRRSLYLSIKSGSFISPANRITLVLGGQAE